MTSAATLPRPARTPTSEPPAPFDYLPPSAVVIAERNVSVSRRGDRVLLVEPESASWGIVPHHHFQFWSRLTRPTRLTDLDNGLPPDELLPLLDYFYRRNLIHVNGQAYYDPEAMWGIQRYPHFINMHMTEACNFACTYCRVTAPSHAPRMSVATAERIAEKCVIEIPIPEIILEFHGGEPLLNLPAIVAAARKGREKGEETGKKVRCMMQSNGALLSPEAVAILKEHQVEVGVSMDGPSWVNDATRIRHDGKGTSQQILTGVRTAFAHKLPVGFLATVHDPAHYVPVLDFFARTMKAHSLRINYSSSQGRAARKLLFPHERNVEFAKHWLAMVDYCVAFHEETGIWLDVADINLFIYHLISKDRPHMCYRSPCGIGNSILGIAHNGDIYLCDELVGREEFKIGNIHDPGNLAELLDTSPIKAAAMEARTVKNIFKCGTCTWKRFHGGGCTAKIYDFYGRIDRESPMCFYYQLIFEELAWKLHDNPSMAGLIGYYGRRLTPSQMERIHAWHM